MSDETKQGFSDGDLKSVLGKISRQTGEQSEGSLLMSAWLRGEITQEQYSIENSRLVATQIQEYQPVPYARMPGALRMYCEDREREIKKRESTMADALGSWSRSIQNAFQENKANESLLRWSLANLEKISDDRSKRVILSMLQRYEYNRDNFPESDCALCIRVQIRDTRARSAA